MVFTTLDEERGEVWSAILDDLRHPEADAARAAARNGLLHHIIDSAAPQGGAQRRERPLGGDPCRRPIVNRQLPI
jgi:hypothetical protein